VDSELLSGISDEEYRRTLALMNSLERTRHQPLLLIHRLPRTASGRAQR